MTAPATTQWNHVDQVLLLLLGSGILALAIFAILAVLISILNYRYTPVRDRLLLLKGKDGHSEIRGSAGPFDDLKVMLLSISGPISKNLYGENEKYTQKVKLLLTEAGLMDNESAIAQFLARRVAVGLVVGGALFVAALILSRGLLFMGLFFLIGGFMVGSLVPQMILQAQASGRKNEIRYSLPDVLDLMVVCVEAGLALDSTIHRISDEVDRMAPQLAYELRRLNKELNAGIPRMEAFQNLGQRSGVDELRSLCAMIIQADKMGTSIADTLRIYADDLRVKRRQKAEELASKASIKMTFPLVFFIFPPLFIILMGPMVIQAIHQFFPNK